MRRTAFALVFTTVVALGAARLIAPGPQRADYPPVWEDPGTGMSFVFVGPLTFRMGSAADVKGRDPQEVLHEVQLTKAFYIGRYEVTQKQWTQVMGSNPSHFSDCGGACPVENVTFGDVQEFIRRVNGPAGRGFRLPTEAEWEAACRAGGSQPFGHLASLSSRDANINGAYPYDAPVGTARNQTTRVGYFTPNPWGIYDMSGNVWEWVEDLHCPYPGAPVRDPVGTCGSGRRVIRGGSWAFDGNSARCGLRYTHRPDDKGYSLGFRLARDPW